eukprot:13712190-Alexandrium_andersonii.AAC.1
MASAAENVPGAASPLGAAASTDAGSTTPPESGTIAKAGTGAPETEVRAPACRRAARKAARCTYCRTARAWRTSE